MKKYVSPQAKTLSGKAISFAGLDRLSSLSVNAAQPIDWHSHQETEILCCLKGSLNYEFRRRPSITLPSGCFLVIPPGIEHRLVGGIDGPCHRCSLFITAPLYGRRCSPASGAELREILSDLLKKRLRPRAFSPGLLPWLTRMSDLTASDRKLTSREKLETRAITLISLISLASAPKPPAPKPEVRLMAEATAWLKSHYAERVSMEQLVAHMGYGRSRFFSLFNKHTGLPPGEWLTRYRFDRAQDILAEAGMSVTEAARRCGFNDPAFFSRAFRRRTGMSPSDCLR